ncbi:MAG: hypothetical protein ACFFCD_06540 [Promethearchaeota archaeon]
MVVGIVNKISGIFYILIGVILTVLGVIVSQLIWSFLPLIEALTGFVVPVEYFAVIAALLILPWITFIIHGIAHYLLGRQIE